MLQNTSAAPVPVGKVFQCILMSPRPGPTQVNDYLARGREQMINQRRSNK